MDDTRFERGLGKIKEQEKEVNKNGNPNAIFAIFLYVVIFSNFDTGVIPAALKPMFMDLSLSSLEEAAIGSLPFFGISFGSVVVGSIMRRFSPIKTLFVALSLNILCSIWFAFSYNLLSMYFSRFFMGFSQAFWVVYGPVWTNHFSPAGRHTTWLGILQGFAPVGIIVGYVITGILVSNWESKFAWRMGVLIQALGETPILFLFIWLKNSHLDISQKSATNSQNSPNISKISVSSILKALFKNFIYILAVCTNCVAFFVVFGLQFWGTLYIMDILNADSNTAMITYTSITITAPFFGVFVGGFISDKCGGYKGKQVLTALKLCLFFSLTATLFGMWLGFVFTLQFWAPLIWFQIFFGACLIPPGSGVVVNSVEKDYQTSASGFAQLVYNIMGYFLSPLFSAFIMERFNDRLEGMIWGFRANQMISLLGVFFSFIAVFLFKRYTLRERETLLGKEDKEDVQFNKVIEITL